MSSAAPAWDAFQREALAELGLRPQVLARAAGHDAAEHDVRVSAAAPLPAQAAMRDARRTDALLAAVARAAGCAPAQVADWPELATLRGDARAKRALWPRLRALRAQARAGAAR